MGNWGDTYEDEKPEQIKVGWTISFKTMSFLLNKISEETKVIDEHHPKEELMSIWTNIMMVYFVLFAFSYSVLIAVTGVFFIFYTYVLVQLYNVWKQFKYSKTFFLGLTAVGMIAAAVLGTFLRNFVMGMI